MSPTPNREALAALCPTLLEYVAANLTEIKDASPDTLDILRSVPDLMFEVMVQGATAAKQQQPAAKRRKTGN